MTGNPNMLELSVITYISILFFKPHLNHPGQRLVTQANFKYFRLCDTSKFGLFAVLLIFFSFLTIANNKPSTYGIQTNDLYSTIL